MALAMAAKEKAQEGQYWNQYLSVLELLVPLVLYRLSTSEKEGTLHCTGRRLLVYVGWVWSP